MEQDRKFRDKPMYLWLPYLCQRRQVYTLGQTQSLQYVVLGKLDNFVFKNEIRTLPNTIHKTNSKWVKDLNVRPKTSKSPRGKYR